MGKAGLVVAVLLGILLVSVACEEFGSPTTPGAPRNEAAPSTAAAPTPTPTVAAPTATPTVELNSGSCDRMSIMEPVLPETPAERVERLQQLGVDPLCVSGPELPATIGYGHPFVAHGFVLIINAPVPFKAESRFVKITHRVKIRLRNMTQNDQTFEGGWNIEAIVNGQVAPPSSLCISACPMNLAMRPFPTYISNAMATGYLYFEGQPNQLRVDGGLFAEKTIVQ